MTQRYSVRSKGGHGVVTILGHSLYGVRWMSEIHLVFNAGGVINV